jgi:glucose-6-phosphate 1-dehydrogenase
MQERISLLRRAECHNAPHSAGRWNLDRIRREATRNAGADDDGSGQLLYQTSFGSKGPVAYETLLLDSMCGDATLFTRRDEVEAEWRIITPIEEAWAQLPLPDIPNHAAGNEGPTSWRELLEISGHTAERAIGYGK